MQVHRKHTFKVFYCTVFLFIGKIIHDEILWDSYFLQAPIPSLNFFSFLEDLGKVHLSYSEKKECSFENIEDNIIF